MGSGFVASFYAGGYSDVHRQVETAGDGLDHEARLANGPRCRRISLRGERLPTDDGEQRHKQEQLTELVHDGFRGCGSDDPLPLDGLFFQTSRTAGI